MPFMAQGQSLDDKDEVSPRVAYDVLRFMFQQGFRKRDLPWLAGFASAPIQRDGLKSSELIALQGEVDVDPASPARLALSHMPEDSPQAKKAKQKFAKAVKKAEGAVKKEQKVDRNIFLAGLEAERERKEIGRWRTWRLNSRKEKAEKRRKQALKERRDLRKLLALNGTDKTDEREPLELVGLFLPEMPVDEYVALLHAPQDLIEASVEVSEELQGRSELADADMQQLIVLSNGKVLKPDSSALDRVSVITWLEWVRRPGQAAQDLSHWRRSLQVRGRFPTIVRERAGKAKEFRTEAADSHPETRFLPSVMRERLAGPGEMALATTLGQRSPGVADTWDRLEALEGTDGLSMLLEISLPITSTPNLVDRRVPIPMLKDGKVVGIRDWIDVDQAYRDKRIDQFDEHSQPLADLDLPPEDEPQIPGSPEGRDDLGPGRGQPASQDTGKGATTVKDENGKKIASRQRRIARIEDDLVSLCAQKDPDSTQREEIARLQGQLTRERERLARLYEEQAQDETEDKQTDRRQAAALPKSNPGQSHLGRAVTGHVKAVADENRSGIPNDERVELVRNPSGDTSQTPIDGHESRGAPGAARRNPASSGLKPGGTPNADEGTRSNESAHGASLGDADAQGPAEDGGKDQGRGNQGSGSSGTGQNGGAGTEGQGPGGQEVIDHSLTGKEFTPDECGAFVAQAYSDGKVRRPTPQEQDEIQAKETQFRQQFGRRPNKPVKVWVIEGKFPPKGYVEERADEIVIYIGVDYLDEYVHEYAAASGLSHDEIKRLVVSCRGNPSSRSLPKKEPVVPEKRTTGRARTGTVRKGARGSAIPTGDTQEDAWGLTNRILSLLRGIPRHLRLNWFHTARSPNPNAGFAPALSAIGRGLKALYYLPYNIFLSLTSDWRYGPISRYYFHKDNPTIITTRIDKPGYVYSGGLPMPDSEQTEDDRKGIFRRVFGLLTGEHREKAKEEAERNQEAIRIKISIEGEVYRLGEACTLSYLAIHYPIIRDILENNRDILGEDTYVSLLTRLREKIYTEAKDILGDDLISNDEIEGILVAQRKQINGRAEEVRSEKQRVQEQRLNGREKLDKRRADTRKTIQETRANEDKRQQRRIDVLRAKRGKEHAVRQAKRREQEQVYDEECQARERERIAKETECARSWRE